MKESFLPAINLALLEIPRERLLVPNAGGVLEARLCANSSSYTHTPTAQYFVYGEPLKHLKDRALVEVSYQGMSVICQKVGWKSPPTPTLFVSPDAMNVLRRTDRYDNPSEVVLSGVSFCSLAEK